MKTSQIIMKNRVTFKSPITVEKERMLTSLQSPPSPSPIHQYIKSKVKCSAKTDRKNIKIK